VLSGVGVAGVTLEVLLVVPGVVPSDDVPLVAVSELAVESVVLCAKAVSKGMIAVKKIRKRAARLKATLRE